MLPEEWLATTLESAAGCPAFPVMGRESVQPPYIVWMRDATTEQDTLSNAGTGPGVVFATYLVDVYADSYLESRQIAAAVRDALRNFSGDIGGPTINVLAMNDRDTMPVLLEGRDSPTYTVEQTYQISWYE